MDPEKIVREFCEAFARLDIDELVGFFSDDAVYHNMPIAPVEGKEQIAATLGQFLDPEGEAVFEILSLSSCGNTVLTERVDHLRIQGKKIAIPVMGAFEVTADGKISAWRDYFDLAQFTNQMG